MDKFIARTWGNVTNREDREAILRIETAETIEVINDSLRKGASYYTLYLMKNHDSFDLAMSELNESKELFQNTGYYQIMSHKLKDYYEQRVERV